MDGCLSTLEAVALALQVLEPANTSEVLSEALLCGFQGMVAIQTQFMQQGKQQTLERYKGVSKREAMLQHQQDQQEQQQHVTLEQERAAKAQSKSPQELLLRREYVFVTTHVDFRQRKQLVQQVCLFDRQTSARLIRRHLQVCASHLLNHYCLLALHDENRARA